MRRIDKVSTDNPKLLKKELKNGTYSLYLEYYLGYSKSVDSKTDKDVIVKNRRKESLGLYISKSPRTPLERQTNKETLELAKRIRFEKEQQMKEVATGYRLPSFKKVNILDCMDAYYDNYTKGDKRMIKAAIKRFKDFLTLENPLHKNHVTAEQMNKAMMERFVEYLKSISKGEGALTHYKRFKKIIKYLVEEDYLRKNPCLNVTCKADEGALKKDILSIEEIQMLINTTYPQQNLEVRRAFIFCLYTGIRFCDVKDLVFSNVDYSNKLLTFNQKKAQGQSSKSWVTIPLNDGLLQLIGTSEKMSFEEISNDNIFKLPSQTMCLRSLKYWVKLAKINKHITWHCARHYLNSFPLRINNLQRFVS